MNDGSERNSVNGKKVRKKISLKEKKKVFIDFKVYYTNCDFGLLSKKDYLNLRIYEVVPCVLALTEVIQKNEQNIPLAE